ncbi:hypothetical protein M2480_001889 [Parabacteroides sp. PFB2-12]|nr:hypothetical protein [Parabacteroides sp. PFB2-12]
MRGIVTRIIIIFVNHSYCNLKKEHDEKSHDSTHYYLFIMCL